MSDEAGKRIRRQIRFWRLHLRSGSRLGDLAREINPIVRNWVSYYGRFYKSELIYVLKGIKRYLMRWAAQKFMSRPGSDGGWRGASAQWVIERVTHGPDRRDRRDLGQPFSVSHVRELGEFNWWATTSS